MLVFSEEKSISYLITATRRASSNSAKQPSEPNHKA